MKKFIKRFNYTLFDVAVGPMILMIFGIPVLIVITIIIIVVIAVMLIKKAVKETKAHNKANPEKPHGDKYDDKQDL